jgi:hypothetical protein
MGESEMALGGVTMQEMRVAPGKARLGEIAQVIVAIVLFSLLMGLWAYLWVPLPIF